MAIDRSQKISAFKTSHQHKRSYNSVRAACVGESQEIQAFSIICPPISHSLTQRFHSPESGKNKARPCVNLKTEALTLGKIEKGNWF